MVSLKRTTTPVPTQPLLGTHKPTHKRTQSDLDWNTPRGPVATPRSEYRFMRSFGVLWMQPPAAGTVPPIGGVIQ